MEFGMTQNGGHQRITLTEEESAAIIGRIESMTGRKVTGMSKIDVTVALEGEEGPVTCGFMVE